MLSRGSSWSRTGLVMVLHVALGAAALVWGSVRGQANIWRLAPAGGARFWGGVATGLALGLAIAFTSRLAVHRFEWARALHRELRSMVGPASDTEIVVLAVTSSIGQEMFFRGALMPAAGVWVSSGVFALLHVAPRLRYLPWTIGSFVAGVLFAELFVWSGDLTGAVLAHFVVNLLNLRHVALYELH